MIDWLKRLTAKEGADSMPAEPGSASGAADVPADYDMLLADGLSLRDGDEREAALQCFERACRVAPERLEAWLEQGRLLADLARLDEAAALLASAVATHPRAAEAWVARGQVQDRLGQHQEALASFDQAIAQDPARAAGHRGRGLALRHLRRLPEAAVSFAAATARDDGDADAWYDLAFTLVAADQPAEARTAFARYLAVAAADHPRREAAQRVVGLLDTRGGKDDA